MKKKNFYDQNFYAFVFLCHGGGGGGWVVVMRPITSNLILLGKNTSYMPQLYNTRLCVDYANA